MQVKNGISYLHFILGQLRVSSNLCQLRVSSIFMLSTPSKIAKGGVPYETDNRKWQHQARQSLVPHRIFLWFSFQGVIMLSFVFAHFWSLYNFEGNGSVLILKPLSLLTVSLLIYIANLYSIRSTIFRGKKAPNAQQLAN